MFESFLQSRKDTYTPLGRDILKAYNQSRPGGAKDLLCYVPFNSLTFSWQGRVYACTYNRNILVGEYPKNSLRDIWFGPRLKKMQDYLRHNDLSYGCQHCKYFVEKRKFTGLKPQSFDKYSDYKKHRYPRVMEFEISNKCNLECIMCNGNTSSAIRQNRDKLPPLPMPYDEAFFEQLREFIPHLKEAKFFGGEPFLIPTYFRIWDEMMATNPDINIFVITNGTVLTEKVKDLLNKGNFELAVSIDSIRKERYEFIRKNADFEQVMSNLEYFNQYSRNRGRTMSLSFTTQKANWDELPEVIEFCNKRGIIFFNSFLTAPHDLSIIFLPSQELHEIHEYLARFQLPETTELEKYNKKVFIDYLQYVKYYEAKNEKGIDHSEQKDNYRAELPGGSERMNKSGTKTELYHLIKNMDDSYDIPNSEIVRKLENLFENVNDPAVEEKILADIFSSPIEVMMRDVSKWKVSEMQAHVQKRYMEV